MFYYSADWHLSHKNIIKYENRPFDNIDDMNQTLIYNHNSILTPDDIWFFLGDFSFANKDTTAEVLSQLNGSKILIAGNHDRLILKQHKSLQSFFIAVVKDYLIIKDQGKQILLSHIPIHNWQKYNTNYHFYGHVHSGYHRTKILDDATIGAFNVGVDVHDFKPVSFNQIINSI